MNSVQFVQQIENIYAQGGYCFVEIGPRQILTNLVKQILGDRPHLAIALNPSRQKDRLTKPFDSAKKPWKKPGSGNTDQISHLAEEIDKLKNLLKVQKLSAISEVKIKNLDHLGIVAGLIDEIGIVEIINSKLGIDPREKISKSAKALTKIVEAIELFKSCSLISTPPLSI